MARRRGFKYDADNARLSIEADGTEVVRFEDDGSGNAEIGFFGAAAVNKPTAYTQTYSTGDKTVENPTATTVGSLGNGADGASSTSNFNKIGTAIDALVADNLDLRKVVTSLIDDLQELGLVG